MDEKICSFWFRRIQSWGRLPILQKTLVTPSTSQVGHKSNRKRSWMFLDSKVWGKRSEHRLELLLQEKWHTGRSLTRAKKRLNSSCQAAPHEQATPNAPESGQRKERLDGLFLSGSKSSYLMRASFASHLATKVPESGGRLERRKQENAWSPVLHFSSLWWLEDSCQLLVLVLCALSNLA